MFYHYLIRRFVHCSLAIARKHEETTLNNRIVTIILVNYTKVTVTLLLITFFNSSSYSSPTLSSSSHAQTRSHTIVSRTA